MHDRFPIVDRPLQRSVGGLILAVLLGVVFQPAEARAQSSVRERATGTQGRSGVIGELEQSRFQWGQFYMYSRLQIGDVGFGEIVLLPDLPDSDDWTEQLAVSVGMPLKFFYVPTKKFAASVSVFPWYLYYLDRDEQDGIHWNARADLHFMFNHLYVDVYTDITDQLVRDRSELNYVASQEGNSVGLVGQFDPTEKTNIRFDARFAQIAYPEDEIDLADPDLYMLDRDEAYYSAMIEHKTFGTTSLSLGAGFDDFQFDDTVRDSQRTMLWVGAFRDKALTDIQARVGMTQMRFDDPDAEDYDGINAFLSWSRSPRANTTLAATLSRDVEFSTFGDNYSYEVDKLHLGWGFPLFRRLSGDLQARFEQTRYGEEEIAEDGITRLREDDFRYAGVGVLIPFPKSSIGLRLQFGFYERDSNFDEFDEKGEQILLRLSI